MAAYSRLASRSQAKFHTMKLSPLVSPCAAAPAQSTTSARRSLRFSPRSCLDVNLTRTVPVSFPRHFRSKKRSHLVAAYLACQSVAGVGVFPRHIWHKTSFILTCVKSRSLPVNKARWWNHVTDLRWVQYSWSHGSASQDGSSSQCDGSVPPGPSRMTTRQGSAAQVPDSAKDDGSSRRVTSQQGGTTRQRMTSQRSWTTQQAWLTQHMMMTTQQAFADPAHEVDDPAHAPEEVLQLPAKRLGDGSSKSKKAITTTSSGSKATVVEFLPSGPSRSRQPKVVQVRESHDIHKFGVEGYGGGAICCPVLPGTVNPRSPWLPACLWWDGPDTTGQNTTDQEMGIAGKGWRASCPGYPSREHSSCKIAVFHVIWCQQFVLPVNGQASNQNSRSSHLIQDV